VLVVLAAKRVQKVLDDFYWIMAREGMLPDSNIFLVKDGERFVLFDAGIHHFFKDTVAAIEELGLEFKQMDRLILTHTHLDHSGSTPEFKGRLKDLEVWVSEEEGTLLEQGDDTIVLGSMLGQRLPPILVAKKLHDGDVINVGAYSFEVLSTPGHSAGSLCFFEPNHKLLISGDVVFRHGSFGRVDFPTGNGKVLIQSIERLASLPVEMLLPGHMGIAMQDGQREIKLSLQFARQVL
jgi:glyoxylase-like metal-dependent hydrolase (beta-lactamase superfamily II)